MFAEISRKGDSMTKVAVLGMGLMGYPMILRLAQAQIPVIAYNRTQAKLESLKEKNIPVTSNIHEAIAFGDVIILMLSDIAAIQEVIFDSGVDLDGKTIIQMGTIAPGESKGLYVTIQEKGGDYLEAPVLGSIPEVKSGKLLLMVGGDKSLFRAVEELLTHFSPKPLYIGEIGSAAALKLALNQMIAGLTSTFALSLSYIQKQGVEVETFMDILRNSALYAPTFDKKLQRMCDHNFSNPNFPTKHLLKDINLFLASAQTINLNTTTLEGIKEITTLAVENGEADSDYSAIIQAIDN
ncbi:NAD(P)-dependent oxidoreductase [Cyanobacterium sp. Dongsha4]|uniref:NAD(P)-dependent oxidoreductase n=1 Tax=Cyanobacterium sp. DS4 TaxID=2878255 RepID=UPI002E805274|nr:NAD(P)-dependent oxidoreductase [Cyanobacterium sp. Dongsha4]WVL00281.1 NAD(P)-dependent oxidoreductase [Cyanobacterium sp. Dongsha4]